MRLTGDRNQCTACGEFFNSTAAFDRHRVGDFARHNTKNPNPYGPVRRCMTFDEMIVAGMSQRAGGFWITRANERYAGAA